jgi:hypothetical protein
MEQDQPDRAFRSAVRAGRSEHFLGEGPVPVVKSGNEDTRGYRILQGGCSWLII